MFIIMMDEISPHKIYHYISIYRFTKNNATGRLRSTSFYSSYKQITVCLQIDFTLRHGMLFAAVMVLILCALTCFIFFLAGFYYVSRIIVVVVVVVIVIIIIIIIITIHIITVG